VYFPNGWFSIRGFENINKELMIKIRITGKLKEACKNLMNRLQNIDVQIISSYENEHNLWNSIINK
jgi:hypothetical protein